MQQIAIEKVRLDGGTQPRATLDMATIASYAEDMANGDTFPPIVAYYDGADYWLVDGFHRVRAAQQADWREITADVHQGTLQEAQWHSYGVNATHGLRRSNEDKRRAVEAALRHEYAGKYSDNEIARHCGVSQPFVSKLRPSYNDYKIDERIATRNGSTYTINTANIGNIGKRSETTQADIDTDESRWQAEEWDEPDREPVRSEPDYERIARERQRQQEKRERHHERVQRDAYMVEQITREPASDRYRLIHSSITDLDIAADSVDVIITDPPYPREYLPVYADLAKLAARVLKPGGSCFVMIGQSYLPDILALMTPHIAYHWCLSYLTPGGQAVQLWQRNVNTFWKPVLWFVKGEYEGKWLGDVSRSNPNDNDKRFHHWGQSESGMADLVERCSVPGNTILDPFCGGGTTGAVALEMGRYFIGADNDQQQIDTTEARLSCVCEA